MPRFEFGNANNVVNFMDFRESVRNGSLGRRHSINAFILAANEAWREWKRSASRLYYKRNDDGKLVSYNASFSPEAAFSSYGTPFVVKLVARISSEEGIPFGLQWGVTPLGENVDKVVE